MKHSNFDIRVAAFRAFTRFYTRKSGVLHEMLLNSPYGLTEARVLYELANRSEVSARELSFDLGLDAGYVSRVLKKFEKHHLITREVSQQDRRQQLIVLTATGRDEFDDLNVKSAQLFGTMLEKLNHDEQTRLIAAMNTIKNLLDEKKANPSPYLLRPHRPGDMGWIVQNHGQIYSEEYGWDDSFEALVAEIVSAFLTNFDAKSDCCWIAEKDGRNVGSAMIVRADETTAKLRLVIVDPAARGYGIGVRLVQECIRFSKRTGYKTMTLWTQKNLHSAIAIYKKLGFQLVREDTHHSFGHDLVGQYWSLDLK